MIIARMLWTTAGALFLTLGVAGVILPMLPGTIFLLAASACFVRGSERLDHWLRNHRVLGRHLRVVTGKEAMPLRAKIAAIAAMWIAVSISIAGTNNLALQIVLTLLAVTGTWFIARRR